MKVVAVIPARYQSSRFPGKPLKKIGGKPLVQWVYERASRAKALSEVLVATDDTRIFSCVKAFGGNVVLTRGRLASGTDRVALAMEHKRADWVLNIQGDEPLVSTGLINGLIRRAEKIKTPAIVTPVTRIRTHREFLDPNIVKVVSAKDGKALYFSRSPIPNTNRANPKSPRRLLRHIGLYLFHRAALRKFAASPSTVLEKTEKLEQLRALDLGIPIHLVQTKYRPVNVDVPNDLKRIAQILRRGSDVY